MRVLVLVMSCSLDDYPELEKKQRTTWDSITRMDVDTIYYSAGDSTDLTDGKLTVKTGEGHGYFYEKTILAFKHLLMVDKDWDYIFKTDNSAYVNKRELVHTLADKPRQGYYGGHLYITTYVNSDPFLWGEGMVLSRDIVQYLVDEYENSQISRSGVEDVHIGMILKGVCKWDTTLTICEYHKQPLMINHVYRCKKDEGTLNDTLKAMDDIHRFLHPARESKD